MLSRPCQGRQLNGAWPQVELSRAAEGGDRTRANAREHITTAADSPAHLINDTLRDRNSPLHAHDLSNPFLPSFERHYRHFMPS